MGTTNRVGKSLSNPLGFVDVLAGLAVSLVHRTLPQIARRQLE